MNYLLMVQVFVRIPAGSVLSGNQHNEMGWLPPSLTASSCASVALVQATNGEDDEVQFQRKLSRQAFRTLMARHPAAAVVMEACGSAHYWSRVLSGFGHEVRLIAPRYVRPFVKRQKNDAADAEAIVVAAQRPEMRFVEPKSESQQSAAILYRSRQRLVRQRTETVNALRAALYEFGHIIPQGIQQFGPIRAILEAPNSDLATLMREECVAMLEQIAVLNGWIDTKTAKIKELAAATPVSKRLQTMPGIGPLVAMAVETFALDMACFHNGRAFAAWLGLVPRQFSSGGKERLGRVSKAGQADIRQMLIIGAMSRLNWMGRKSSPESSWLARMMARKPRMLVAIALANKMARQIWAMLTKNEDYKNPMPVMAA